MDCQTRDKLKELWNQTPRLTVREISEISCVKYVYPIIRRMILKGELLPRSRMGATLTLTQEQQDKLEQIVAMRESGMKWKDIGKEFSLTRQRVYRYVQIHFPEYFEKNKI